MRNRVYFLNAVKCRGIKNRIHERGYRDRPLTQEQEERNRMKSKIRIRIKLVFGFMENTIKAAFIKCIGGVRTAAVIGLL